MRTTLSRLALAAAALVAAAPALSACLTDAQVAALADAYYDKRPAPNPEGLSAADGECSRAKLLALFDLNLRERAGYKAGLTNPAVQKRFNADAPVWGVLYASMLLPDGSAVDARFGARPLYEADLLVRVKDAAVNGAKTPADVIAAIDQVIPFIELPDLVVEAPPRLNGAAITAINVGARLGVTGRPIAVPVTRGERYQLLDALGKMTVIVKADGAEVDRGKGSDVLEHPLNAVVWLAQDLKRHGLALKPGDVVSLGSFSRLLPPKAGQKVEVEYWGLPEPRTVSVSFR
ncbi:2-keto-4-pentenoate hydratase [Azohydromonas sediminis]|uniref:2-keto-4-pentenoate hydratase n=1 Tax=Azohydromonas sediminis TaxID=2259674 RepID=UPI000E654EE6|nr:fumarylacetoacetate hydrolase [Azohydromonas sediminis]